MSTYCGFIYNEFFALPLNIFPSCYDIEKRDQWKPAMTADGDVVGEYTYLRRSYDCNYPAGLDPIWSLATNKLLYSNNIKMKISVIMGVLHMSIGIFMKGTNSVFFRRWADLFTEVITGFIILWALFGWMDALIFAKWFYPINIEDTTIHDQDEMLDKANQDIETDVQFEGDYENERAPSVINILITTVFNFGKTDKDQIAYIGGSQDTMYSIGLALLITTIALIPIMLFCKPCFFREKGREQEAQEIEFTQIRSDEQQQNLLENDEATEQMMAERANQLKIIER